MFLAVFKQVDRANQVMLNYLSAASCALDTRENAGIRGSVDDPIRLGQRVDVTCIANVGVVHKDTKIPQGRSVHFASWPHEIVDAENLCAFEALTNRVSQSAAHKPANTGN